MAHRRFWPRRPPVRAIAFWRYQQIEPALACRTREERGRELRLIARRPVVWPSGDTRPVGLATLYRWVSRYLRSGLEGLRPAVRKDKGRKKARLPVEVVKKAAALLSEDPEMSFTFLLSVLGADPELDLRARKLRIVPSTLRRRLAADPVYVRLQRARKQKRRCRFVARRPHQIWHLDAKGPVSVRFVSGKQVAFHVLSVLDDATRAVLAALIAPSPNQAAAVRVFRLAARRWGLPDRIYADRASIFDSVPFRAGLAQLGSHRIRVKARNPEANGKIEAYHRALVAWFTGRLKSQKVVDLEHLQQLLEAVLEVVYQNHRHRQLRCSPREALGDQTSARKLSAARLDAAFRDERVRKAHPKTGEVDIGPHTFVVPEPLRGQRLTFLVDPEPDIPPLLVEPGTGRHLVLERAQVRPEDCTATAQTTTRQATAEPPVRWGHGPLQTLYDTWQGKVRPVAEPGFGLPELFELLAQTVGRMVPRSDSEAALIQRVYRTIGPLPSKATETVLRRIGRRLGTGRPIQIYLDALAASVTPRIKSPETRNKTRRSSP
jgi:transposase InsO family protein